MDASLDQLVRQHSGGLVREYLLREGLRDALVRGADGRGV